MTHESFKGEFIAADALVERELLTDGIANPAAVLDMHRQTRLSLSPDFECTYKPDAAAVAELKRDHYPVPDLSLEEDAGFRLGSRRMGELIEVGVTSKDELVGYGGLILDLEGCPTARMIDFVVHKGFRSRGIGRFIIDKGIEEADRRGIECLWGDLADSNNLKRYFLQRGFRLAADGRMTRGPSRSLYDTLL